MVDEMNDWIDLVQEFRDDRAKLEWILAAIYAKGIGAAMHTFELWPVSSEDNSNA